MVGVDFTVVGNPSRAQSRSARKRDASEAAVRHLPHDVIHLIVRRFYRCHADVFPAWNYGDYATGNAHTRQRTMLPLAAVNSAWRQAVLPFLYMSIVCEETPMPARPHYATDRYRHCYWHTNLRLFDASTAKWARNIFVLSSKNGANIESLALALTRQGFAQLGWPRLSSLHLAIVASACVYNSPVSAIIHPDRMAKDPIVLPMLGASYSGIPGMCSYILDVVKQVQHNNTLSSESGQLLTWNNEDGHPAQGSILRVSLGLLFATDLEPLPVHIVRLKVRYYDALVALLARLSPVLYDLGISDIPQSGIIDVLCLGAVVPGVKSLSLAFSGDIARWWTAERNEHDAAMQFAAHSSLTARPLSKLSQLRVKNYPHNVSSCLAFLVRGQSLDYVYIETSSIATIERLDVSAIGLRTRSFSLACIGNVHTSEERAEKVISRVLCESSACIEYLRISVSLQHGVKLTPDPDLILLPGLRSLTLRVPISLDRVAAVVAQIPRLRMLKAPYISTTTGAPDAPHTIEALWRLLRQRSQPVISTSLEQVTLGFWDYQYNTRQLCCLILGFVSRIPSILTLVHDPGFAPTLKWTKDCLVVLAESLGGLFGQIPDHMHDLVIADHQKNIF